MKVKEEYKEAYAQYKERVKSRTHKYGNGSCVVCESIFKKKTGSHIYCSKPCSLISQIKKSNEQQASLRMFKNNESRGKIKDSSGGVLNMCHRAMFKAHANILGTIIYNAIMNPKPPKTKENP